MHAAAAAAAAEPRCHALALEALKYLVLFGSSSRRHLLASVEVVVT